MPGRRSEISPSAVAAAYACDPERRLSATPSTLMGAVVQSPSVPWVIQPGSVRIGGVSCRLYTAQRKRDCDQAGGWGCAPAGKRLLTVDAEGRVRSR
jgi:hypothetical protein